MTKENRGTLAAFATYVTSNILGMIGLSCYILADTFFVARGCGAAGLTALNLALPAYSLMHGLGLMTGMGGATRYAIAQAGDRTARQNVFSHALCLSALMSAPFLAAGLTAPHPLAALLGADGAVIGMTVEYLRTILLFAPAYFLNNLVLAFLRNDGAPRLAMAAMLSGSIANIFLDYLFIFPLGMGMFGAALATGIAPCIGLAVQSLHFLRGKNGFSLRRTLPDVRQALGILSLGASSFVLELSSGVVLLTFNMLLLRISGNMGVAAYGVVANIALVVIALFTGVSQGMQPVLSGCFSRGGHGSAALVYRAAVVTALALAAAAWLLGSLFAGPVVSLFNREGDRELARLAVSGIRIYFVSFPFAGINIVTAAAMSAVDRPREGFLISILRGLAVMLPMAAGLAALFGTTGVWASVPAAEAVVFLLLPLIFRMGSKSGPGFYPLD